MLNEIRSHASNLGAKLLLAFLVLTFGVWGVGDMLRQHGSNASVATVGGKSISLDEYQRALRRETENLRSMMGDHYSPEILAQLHVPQEVLKQLVDDALLKRESESLQLVPGDADIVRRIRSNPGFLDKKGNFDKNIFEERLQSAGLSEKAYVEQLRQNLATSLLTDTMASVVPVSPAEVAAIYDARQEQRTALFYPLGANLVANVGAPSQAQLEDYYHRHEADFTAPEYRTISYVSFNAADVQAKATVSDDALHKAYNDRIDEFKQPERRDVEQLLYDSEAKAKQALAEIKGGQSFEEVAKTTPILNKNAVELGTVDRSHIFEGAENAVFSLPAGGVTQPIQSPFGWHIFKVSKIVPAGTASFEEVRPQLEKELREQAADAALNNFANQLQDSLAGGDSLQDAAKPLGLSVHSVGPVSHDGKTPGGEPAKNLPALDKFLDTAFKTDEKTESSLVTSQNGVYYLLRVDSLTPARVKTLAEVKTEAEAGWRKETQGKALATLATGIAKTFADKAAREHAISQYGLKATQSPPFKRSGGKAGDLTLPEPLVAEVFAKSPSEATDAYALPDGTYVIAVVENIVPASRQDPKRDEALAQIRKELGTTAQNEVADQYLRYLAGKYPVTVDTSLLSSSDAE